jgi:hypothetical protein
MKQLYNVEKLKRVFKKSVLFYEVYYLGNAPSMVNVLQKDSPNIFEWYDAHLCVSELTEIKSSLPANVFPIGLQASNWNLRAKEKPALTALIDFSQPGYEAYRSIQINALEKAGIKYTILDRPMSVEDIRAVYQNTSIYFLSSLEAFGLPILECFSAGAQVFTPDSAWPMSWRLNDDATVHGPGTLPDCFTVYDSETDLYEKLIQFKLNFDRVNTPLNIFKNFYQHYSSFYDGNNKALVEAIDFVKSRNS